MQSLTLRSFRSNLYSSTKIARIHRMTFAQNKRTVVFQARLYSGGSGWRPQQTGNQMKPRGFQDGEFGQELRQIQWDKTELSPIVHHYIPHPQVQAQTDAHVQKWRKGHDMAIEGKDCPKPILSFDESPFPPQVIATLKKKFPAPTPIQSQGWPIALSGRDMVGRAVTGSGKTLGFVLPALEFIRTQQQSQDAGKGHPSRGRSATPYVLVLGPTRELVQQIEQETLLLCKPYGVHVSSVFGGAGNRYQQLNSIRNGPQILIATPGRLIDLVSEGYIDLAAQTSYVVLDEADRMLEMGFEKQMRQIIGQIRPDRQLTMWSATWEKNVAAIARDYFSNPVTVIIGGEDLKANPDVKQKIVVTEGFQKLNAFLDLVCETQDIKTLVFCQTKQTCEFLANKVWDVTGGKMNFSVMHGDKSQNQREATLSDFKSGSISMVIATDVAARGLDVKNIERVINYDFPLQIDTYIHRIGRTGRAGKKGESVSFFTPDDQPMANDLISVMKGAGQEPPLELTQLSRSSVSAYSPPGRSNFGGGSGGRGGNSRGSSSYGGDRQGGNPKRRQRDDFDEDFDSLFDSFKRN